MSDCKCNQDQFASNEHVPNFATVGFDTKPTPLANQNFALQLQGVQVFLYQTCVTGTYTPNNNQLCFTLPLYGDYCLTLPVHIPLGGQINICAATCGSWIPTGLKVTVNLNGNPIYTKVLFGSC